MTKEKFVMVSLKEDKAKKLAQVISSDTCRKILDYLTEKDASETELSEKLSLPISTVHYNVQQLVKSSLIKADKFRWSEKGKEIQIYTLAKKTIIISSEKRSELRNNLRNILGVVLFGILAAFLINVFYKKTGIEQAVDSGVLMKARENLEASSTLAGGKTAFFSLQGLWFFYGILFAVLVCSIIILFRREK